MAESLTAVTSVAGIVGLADVALRLSKEVYVFFSAIADASEQIRRMITEVESTNRLLIDVRNLSDEHQKSLYATRDNLGLSELVKTLEICQKEAQELDRLVKSMESTQSTNKVKRLANRFQWVAHEASLKRLCQDLNRHKASLTMALSISGRRHEIELRRVGDVTCRSLSRLQASTTSQHQTVLAEIQHSRAVGSQSLEETIQEMRGMSINRHDIVGPIKDALSTTAASMRSEARSIRVHQRDTRRQIQGGKEVSSQQWRSVRRDLSHANIENMHAILATKDIVSQMDQKMEKLSSYFAAMTNSASNEGSWQEALASVDLEAIDVTLALMKKPVLEFLNSLVWSEAVPELSPAAIELAQSEFIHLLASYYEQSALLVRQLLDPKPPHPPLAQRQKMLPAVKSQLFRKEDARKGIARSALDVDIRTIDTEYGSLGITVAQVTAKDVISIRLDSLADQYGPLQSIVSLSAFSKLPSVSTGFRARFVEDLRDSHRSIVDRSVRTFEITPGDVPIMGALLEDDAPLIHIVKRMKTVHFSFQRTALLFK